MTALARSTGRVLRLTFASCLVGTICYVVYHQLLSCVSVDAVAGAQLSRVDAPIAGYAALASLEIGQIVDKHDTLADIHNPFEDPWAVNESRAQFQWISAQSSALRQALTSRSQRKSRASQSASASLNATTTDLERRIEYSKNALNALTTRREQYASAVERVGALAVDGLTSQDRLTELRSKLLAADADVQRAASELHSLQLALEGNHVLYDTYPRKHTDDLEDRFTQMIADVAASEGHRDALQKKVEADAQAFEQRTHVVVVAPIRGRVWQIQGTDGQYIKQGSSILTLASCERPVVAALVSGFNFERIDIGTKATFESVDGQAYDLVTVQKTGFTDLAESSITAPGVIPNLGGDRRKLYLVLLEPAKGAPWQPGTCAIGTAGIVHFRSRTSWLKWLN